MSLNKNRIVKKKDFLTDSNLWGDSINQIHFRADGTAWASNGEYATKIFYNPFDGNKLCITETDDYVTLLPYLINKKIKRLMVSSKKVYILLDNSEIFEILLENRTMDPIDIKLPDIDKILGETLIDAYTDARHRTILNEDGVLFNKEINGILKTEKEDFIISFLVHGSINNSFILKKVEHEIVGSFDILD